MQAKTMVVHMHHQVRSEVYSYCSQVRHDWDRMNNYLTFVIYRSVLPELQHIMTAHFCSPTQPFRQNTNFNGILGAL